MYPNGSTHAPVAGDILIWGTLDQNGQPWPAGSNGAHDGHIAVVAAVGNGMVITAEQNVKWGDSDHPSDSLALTHVGSGWVLSGSTAHETGLPTYRWRRTMGTSRGTFGWLHSVRNAGAFPSPSRAAASKTTPTPTPSPTATSTIVPSSTPGVAPSSAQAPVELPSLAPAVVVTGGGTLADLVWSQSDSTSPSAQGTPVASVRSLASPAKSPLVPGQDPAVLALANGTRYVFAVGQDGHLYQARTDPALAGVAWSDLGAPDNVLLAPSPVATMYAGGMAVVARGVDGSLWWRAGAPGWLGSWMPVGASADPRVAPSLILSGAPGSGDPLLLALGADGRLYQRQWQNRASTQDDPDGQAGWSTPRPVVSLPAGVRLAGHLAWITEPSPDQSSVGDWSDAPLDIFALDTTGALWRLRCTDVATGWTATRVAPADGAWRHLLSAALVVTPADKPGAPAASANVYVSEISATYRYSMPQLPAASAQPQSQPQAPDRLPALPADVGDTAGSALPLGGALSALVVPAVNGVQAIGTADALSSLGVAASASDQATAAPVLLGRVPQAGMFSDSLQGQAADARWVPDDATHRVVTTSDGTRLDSSDAGEAALFQTTPSSDITVAVHAAIDGKGGDSVASLQYGSAGSNWAALQLGGDGRVRLCIAMGTGVPQCSAPVTLPAGDGGAWLKLTLYAGSVTGWASQDGTSWVEVDSQRLAAATAAETADRSTSQAKPTPTATPAAPTLVQPSETLLYYTEVGLCAEGTSKTSAVFHDFRVTTGAGAAAP